MSTQDILDFFSKHRICIDDKHLKEIINNHTSMHEVWLTATPDLLIYIATCEGMIGNNQLRLFSCWCVRHIWNLLTDEHSRNAVIIAEKYAVGEATEDELAVARAMAWVAHETSRGLVYEAAALAACSNDWLYHCVQRCAVITRYAQAKRSFFSYIYKKRLRVIAETQAAYLREHFSQFLQEGKK